MMLARWRTLCARIGIDAATDGLFDALAAAYAEPGRHYHNLQHVADCLDLFEPVRNLAEAPLAVEFALWYHDAVYDAHATDNEERSAALAGVVLAAAGATPSLVDQVGGLVLATRHNQPPRTADEALCMDIDIAILGSPRETFDRYEAGVRREYGWVPDTVFWSTRSAILRGFLARTPLFHTIYFRDRLERVARENLECSIRRKP